MRARACTHATQRYELHAVDDNNKSKKIKLVSVGKPHNSHICIYNKLEYIELLCEHNIESQNKDPIAQSTAVECWLLSAQTHSDTYSIRMYKKNVPVTLTICQRACTATSVNLRVSVCMFCAAFGRPSLALDDRIFFSNRCLSMKCSYDLLFSRCFVRNSNPR